MTLTRVVTLAGRQGLALSNTSHRRLPDGSDPSKSDTFGGELAMSLSTFLGAPDLDPAGEVWGSC